MEALAELQDMAKDALRYYPYLKPDIRWVLVEATNRILPEVGRTWAATPSRSCARQHRGTARDSPGVLRRWSRPSDGTEFDSDTLIWTAGVKAHPLVGASDLLGGREGPAALPSGPAVDGVDDACGRRLCGRSRTSPSITPGAICGPSAQHAVRQAKILGDNIAVVLRGRTRTYVHKYVGRGPIGLHKGSPRSTGSSCAASSPGSCTGPITSASRPSTASPRGHRLDPGRSFFRREIVSLGRGARAPGGVPPRRRGTAQPVNGFRREPGRIHDGAR